MKTFVLAAAMATLSFTGRAGKLVELKREPKINEEFLLKRGFVETADGWVDPSKPVDTRNAARMSLLAPQRLPLPSGGEAAALKMYEARKDYMVMAGDVFIEQVDYTVSNGKVTVAPKATLQSLEVGQHAGNGVYLAEGNDLAVDTGNPALADGTKVEGYLLDDGLFVYTSVLNAPRQIAKARLVQPRQATYEEFKAAAMAGYPFKTTVLRKFKCSACQGARVIHPKGQQDKGQKRLCTDCSGHGEKEVPVAAVMVSGGR